MEATPSMEIDNPETPFTPLASIIPADNNELLASEEQPNKRRRKKSIVWEHFTIETVGPGCLRACCKQCKKSFAYITGSKLAGTSHLKRHIALGICPVSRQKNESSPYAQGPKTDPPKRRYRASPGIATIPFDPDRCSDAIAKMIIQHEYPLHIVEHPAFIDFVRTLQPQYNMVSFNTIQGDCVAVYLKEKQNLFNFISGIPGRVNLTLDLATSNLNMGYAFLTGHFMDGDWTLHRRILNVIMLPFPDSDYAFNQAVVSCLSDWQLESKLFTLTLDQSFSNETIVGNLRGLLSVNNPLTINGQLLKGNCYARVLSRLARDALRAMGEIVGRIRESVKYVKTSDAHDEKFTELRQQLQVPSTKELIIDDRTKWNTTYQMLVAASELKEVFACLDTTDPVYKINPSIDDWKKVEILCTFLKLFFEAANILTGPVYPPANAFYHEVSKIQLELTHASMSQDPFVANLAKPLKEKFDQYWKECFLVLAIAVVMDPRFKMKLVEFSFSRIFGEDAGMWIKLVDDGTHELFLEYLAPNLHLPSTSMVERGVGIETSQDIVLVPPQECISEEILPEGVHHQEVCPQEIHHQDVHIHSLHPEQVPPQELYPGEVVTHQEVQPKGITLQDVHVQKTMPQDVHMQEVPPQDVHMQEVPPQDQEVHSEEVAPQDVHSNEAVTQEDHNKEAPAQEVYNEEAPAQEVHNEEALAQEVHNEEALVQEVHNEEALVQEVHNEEALAQEVHNEEAPAQEVHNEEAPAQEVHNEEAPAQVVNYEEAPAQVVNYEEALAQEVHNGEAAAQAVHNEEALPQEVLNEEAPAQEVHNEEALPQEVLNEEAPAQEVHNEEALPQEVLNEEAPAQEVHNEEALPQEVLNEEAPAQEVHNEAPPQEVLNEEAPLQEVHNEEALPQKVPNEEAAPQEVPNEEAPPQEVPNEEAPPQEVHNEEALPQEVHNAEVPAQDMQIEEAMPQEVEDEAPSPQEVHTEAAPQQMHIEAPPAHEMHIEEVPPAHEVHTEEAPLQKLHTEEAPLQAPLQKLHTEEAPLQELHTEEAPLQELHTEEASQLQEVHTQEELPRLINTHEEPPQELHSLGEPPQDLPSQQMHYPRIPLLELKPQAMPSQQMHYSGMQLQEVQARELSSQERHPEVFHQDVHTQDLPLLSIGDGLSDFDVYISEINSSQYMKSELDQYLEESLLPRVQEFDVLGWWKLNKLKYPILSKLAADILSIPVSTVDPDSVFDTESKKIDSYRSSLRPVTLEALICAKDWLQYEPSSSSSMEMSNAIVKMEY